MTPSRPGGLWRSFDSEELGSWPGGFWMWGSYPADAVVLAAIGFGSHYGNPDDAPYKADVLLALDQDRFRLIYKGEAPGIPGPYLHQYWDSLASGDLLAPDVEMTIWWPEGIDRFLYYSSGGFLDREEHRYWMDELGAEAVRGLRSELQEVDSSDAGAVEDALSRALGVSVDLDQHTATGSFEQIRSHGWSHNDTSKVIVETAIAFGAGVTLRVAYETRASFSPNWRSGCASKETQSDCMKWTRKTPTGSAG